MEEQIKQSEEQIGHGTGDPRAVEDQEQQEQTQEKKKSFDDVLRDPEMQAEFDRRTAKAIDKSVEKALAKWQEEQKLTADELARKRMTEREQAIAEREAELNHREYLSDIKVRLQDSGLPMVLAEVLAIGVERDNIDDMLTMLQKEWEASITEQIKTGARQSDAKASGSATGVNPMMDLAAFARENRKVN